MGNASNGQVWALVLAGGDGTRLRDFTRLIAGAPIPKQYCRILGRESLLEATLARARLFAAPERILAIVNRDHLVLARAQLRTIPRDNAIVQPSNRDTGPGMVSALIELSRRDPEATVVVLPSDHFVADDDLFAASIAQMIRVVARQPERIALLGIRPENADPGFGYIVPRTMHEVAPVARFEEKPSVARAEAILRDGALWSSFIMAFRVGRLLELLRLTCATEVAAIEEMTAEPSRRAEAYAALPRWNFSRDFLEHHAEQLLVVRGADFGWSDWGTPEAIARTVLSLGLNPPWLRLSSAAAAAAVGGAPAVE